MKNATPPVLSSAADLLAERRVLARRGWVGEKSGLFEHPAWYSSVVMDSKLKKHWHVHMVFRSLLAFQTA